MKLLFAPDSFKGSLSAAACCKLLERAARRVFPGAETVLVPMADGGEGTVDALMMGRPGRRFRMQVTGPLFAPVEACWGLTADDETAVLEMAQASGLPLVPEQLRDPRNTTSLGTGEMIANALRAGVKHILIGIGGSATNDGGMGMLQALGAVFTDAAGRELRPVGGELIHVAHADFSGLMPELKRARITVICDVTNPLLGENGAACVYGPQKGATPAIVEELEAGMVHYAQVVEAALSRDISRFSGAGAAGGLGAALGGVLGAELRGGADAVMDAVHFDALLAGVSLVITGEGRMDGQSLRYGKAPVRVAERCAERGIPVAALVGSIGDGAQELYNLCESTVFPIVPGPMPLAEAMAGAPALYEAAAERLLRAVRIGMRIRE